jgi:hypothetical protein
VLLLADTSDAFVAFSWYAANGAPPEGGPLSTAIATTLGSVYDVDAVDVRNANGPPTLVCL